MKFLESWQIFERKFNTKQRETAAEKGNALPDGSYPISNKEDLKNAIKAQGRGLRKADDKRKKQVHAHIRKRAKALGVEVTTNDKGNIVLKD